MKLFRPSFSVMVILAAAMLFLMPYAVAQDDDEEGPLQKLLGKGGLLEGIIGDGGLLSGLLGPMGLLNGMLDGISLDL
ncbi:unnamed protein product [Larinioides sclopetarius]|uniref:Secreted protein n=1 Tax=Larinioides sclopetarius TaxID=280406 RepID=A0AAV1ZW42_9ARAC